MVNPNIPGEPLLLAGSECESRLIAPPLELRAMAISGKGYVKKIENI